ncbi:MAG: hypothetical protein J2P32_16060, partial [Actinobacteria bacterium]|nr:hypothetical protein [Actinomycetota bacterium]
RLAVSGGTGREKLWISSEWIPLRVLADLRSLGSYIDRVTAAFHADSGPVMAEIRDAFPETGTEPQRAFGRAVLAYAAELAAKAEEVRRLYQDEFEQNEQPLPVEPAGPTGDLVLGFHRHGELDEERFWVSEGGLESSGPDRFAPHVGQLRVAEIDALREVLPTLTPTRSRRLLRMLPAEDADLVVVSERELAAALAETGVDEVPGLLHRLTVFEVDGHRYTTDTRVRERQQHVKARRWDSYARDRFTGFHDSSRKPDSTWRDAREHALRDWWWLARRGWVRLPDGSNSAVWDEELVAALGGPSWDAPGSLDGSAAAAAGVRGVVLPALLRWASRELLAGRRLGPGIAALRLRAGRRGLRRLPLIEFHRLSGSVVDPDTELPIGAGARWSPVTGALEVYGVDAAAVAETTTMLLLAHWFDRVRMATAWRASPSEAELAAPTRARHDIDTLVARRDHKTLKELYSWASPESGTWRKRFTLPTRHNDRRPGTASPREQRQRGGQRYVQDVLEYLPAGFAPGHAPDGADVLRLPQRSEPSRVLSVRLSSPTAVPVTFSIWGDHLPTHGPVPWRSWSATERIGLLAVAEAWQAAGAP